MTKIFEFKPRWKEELVVTGPGGSFVLDLTMGKLIAYLPTRAVWEKRAPQWARHLWPALEAELREWCKKGGIELAVDETAVVLPEKDG